MKKYTQYILIASLMMVLPSWACDVCNMYDYSGRQNQTFMGLFYRYRVMNGYSHITPQSHRFVVSEPNKGARTDHDLQGDGFYHHKTNADFQKYHVADLRFNYALKDKANVGIIIPLLVGKAYYEEIFFNTKPMLDSTISTQGLGDIMLFSDYVFSWQKSEKRAYLKPGLALKLPTGNSSLGSSGVLYPHELQSGTGTIDVILRLNANVRNNKLGMEWISNYRINSRQRKNEYKFGNSLNVMLNTFYVVELNEDWSIVPKFGAYSELVGKDKVNAEKQVNTGGNTWYGNIGIDLVYSKINLQTLFQRPVYDRLNGEQIGNAGRMIVGVIYNF